jgi:SNF2 family DNA or RNA helicase
MNEFFLKINEQISLNVCSEGLRILCQEVDINTKISQKPENLYEKKVYPLLPILVEMGLAETEENGFLIPNQHLDELYGDNSDTRETLVGDQLIGILPSCAPFTIDIENSVFLANSELEYRIRFHHGLREVYPKRIGRFLKISSQYYILPYNLFELIETIDEFNLLPPQERTTETNYQYFSKIKLLGEGEVNLSEAMQNERIFVPQQMGLNFETDEEGRLYVYPEFDGIDKQSFKEQFLAQDHAKSIYRFVTPDGGRKRIVISPEIKDAMNHMRQNLMGLSGDEKDRVLLKPQDVFAGVCPPETIKTYLEDFGPRVIGIGPYVYQPIPKLKQVDRPNILGDWDTTASPEWQPILDVVDGEGKPVDIPLEGEEQITDLRQQVQSALLEGKTTIEIHTKEGERFILAPSTQLAQNLEKLSWVYEEKTKPIHKLKDEQASKFVLIEDNLGELGFNEISKNPEVFTAHTFERPNSLIDSLNDEAFDLKSFQKEGVTWLQANFIAGRSGVLLADDMGLGKTLQVLSFLAWLIENGWKKHLPINDPLWDRESFSNGFPYNHPILIVAPITLLENWESEIEKFFKANNEIFNLVFTIKSSNIKSLLKNDSLKGREYKTGYASLDLDLLKRFKVIITNYDTVKNYQHSFGRVRWSVLITDEAQEIKNPKPDVTRALKEVASNSRYKIAMTGTPIENTLLDLWCIMDFCSPGLLGSAKEFRNKYENHEGPELQNTIALLRNDLQHNQGHSAYVLSRFKEEYLRDELPTKIVDDSQLPLSARFTLSATEWQTVEDIFRAGLKIKKRGHHFEIIHQLAKFYQHPALLQDNWQHYTTDEMLKMSTKFNWLYQCLLKIQSKGQKALIFTRAVNMQQLIRQMLVEKFGVSLAPINGESKSTARTGKSERHKTLEAFKDTPGFCALILSPDVAGVGLNIVEANHVIHYGRWWNPALEDQATCRAYRLGQKNNVYVYYPISQSPIEGKTTFDETLHQLLEYKSGLRKDFLIPIDACNVNELDALNDMFKQFDLVQDTEPFSWQDLNTINGYEFEGFVSLLLKAQGYQTWVTPRTHDYGADVVAVKDNIAYLVQCKHGNPDAKVVEELISAFDSYIQWIPAKKYKISLVLATSQKIKGKVNEISKNVNREILPWDKDTIESWLKKTSLTRSDILAEDMQRLSSAKDIAKQFITPNAKSTVHLSL